MQGSHQTQMTGKNNSIAWSISNKSGLVVLLFMCSFGKTGTFGGTEERMPARAQERAHARHAGRNLSVQNRTDLLADLQQVVWCHMSVGSNLATKIQMAHIFP